VQAEHLKEHMNTYHRFVVGTLIILTTAGCVTPGANLGSNVYQASQVNSRQEAKVIDILMVAPAKVEVDNAQNRQTAQIVGGVLGAIAGGVLGNNLGRAPGSNVYGAAGGGLVGLGAGSLVKTKVLVDGVSITYVDNGQTFSSAQVGKLCEFAPGRAVVIATSQTETRIQANATCPPPATK
jgi:outer membrane lipoprotein SlyB